MESKEVVSHPEKLFVENNSLGWEEVAVGVQRKIMTYNEEIMLVRVSFEKGSIGVLHKHYHVQISSIESGVFEVEIDSQKNRLKAGDAFYIPPNILHGVVCLEAGVVMDVFSPMREDFITKD